ncbi:shikimate dehydrogenase [Nostocoides sp. F2B08]|uniref:shikimate dehydrogenase n=1 Tax=Nostocoides sp. F2B08 TaxID=2653936 RepID=UPI00186ACEF4|nr:shikimate dehydrogenase [Tetrasphaera sp. F2B08]
MADRTTRRAAVLGSPISHSLSPALHEAAYRSLGLSGWSYTAIEMAEPGLAGFVEGLDASWRGLSLTMPLKEVAFDVAAESSQLARDARSINTLVRRPDGAWVGHNTDVHGIVAALRSVDHGGAARVIGAGATARSAVLALRSMGVARVEVAARRPDAARTLADLAQHLGLRARPVPLTEWASSPPPLIVSTVPAGAGPPLARSATAMRGITLFDVVYAPWPSPLAAAVETAGGRVVSGLEMLLHQAARQVEIFTGGSPDVDAMRAAVGSAP